MRNMPEIKCLNCGLAPIIVFHTMIDGNDYDFCSVTCIKKYSKRHPKERIVLIEKFRGKREWRIA